jgi:hypothetical protein
MRLIETPVSAAIKGTIEGTFGLAGKVVEATGNAVRGVGEAVGGAMQGALSPAPVTVINGVGMAGRAAQAKVSGSGTIPASPKKSARPAANPNMPTEKLLVVAVNYLSSIEKTLEQQLQFERRAFQQQAQAEKEAAIESGGSRSIQNPFSNLGEKLGAVKDNAKERAGTLGKLLIGGGLLGALGLGAIGNLDTSQLDELKSNWAAFTDKISPIIGFVENFANAMGTTALAGAAAGFMFGGPRGALAGLIGGKIYEDAYGTFNPETGQREGGKGLLSTIVSNFPLAALALAPVTTVKFAYKGVKAAAGAVTGFVARQAARFSAWFAEKAFIRFAFSAYGKNRLWNLFLKYLEKKAKQRLLAEIAAIGAVAVATTSAEAAIASTGIGVPVAAVSAVVTKLIAAGFAAWLLWDLYQIWVEFSETAEAKAQQSTDDERANATPASSTTTTSDASAVAGSPVTSSTTQPISTTSATSGQNKTITGVVEGGRGYTTVTYSDGTTERRGGTLPARTNNPGNIMEGPIARSYGSVGSSPSTNGPPVAVFPTPEMGFAAMDGLLRSRYSNGPIGQTLDAWATDPTHVSKVIGTAGVDPNKRYTDFTAEERTRFQQALAKVEGFYAAGSGPTMVSGTSSLASTAIDMGKGTLEFVSNVLRAGFGPMRPTSGSQLSGFNDNMQGNIGAIAAATPNTSGNAPAVAAPVQGESATAAQLARTSAQIQNAVDLGNATTTAAEIQQESTSAASIRQANSSNDGKLEALDPNFPGTGAVEAYLQYHRLAA